MGKQTHRIEFEGDSMDDMISQIIVYLKSINVLRNKEEQKKEQEEEQQ